MKKYQKFKLMLLTALSILGSHPDAIMAKGLNLSRIKEKLPLQKLPKLSRNQKIGLGVTTAGVITIGGLVIGTKILKKQSNASQPKQELEKKKKKEEEKYQKELEEQAKQLEEKQKLIMVKEQEGLQQRLEETERKISDDKPSIEENQNKQEETNNTFADHVAQKLNGRGFAVLPKCMYSWLKSQFKENENTFVTDSSENVIRISSKMTPVCKDSVPPWCVYAFEGEGYYDGCATLVSQTSSAHKGKVRVYVLKNVPTVWVVTFKDEVERRKQIVGYVM